MLRPCSYCLHNDLRYIKLVVLGVSVVSESRNQTAHGIFKEIKLSRGDGFSINLLWVIVCFLDVERANLVPRRTLLYTD